MWLATTPNRDPPQRRQQPPPLCAKGTGLNLLHPPAITRQELQASYYLSRQDIQEVGYPTHLV